MGGVFSLLEPESPHFEIDGLGFKRPKAAKGYENTTRNQAGSTESHKKLTQLLLSNHNSYCVLQSAPSLAFKAKYSQTPHTQADQLQLLKNYRRFHNNVAQALISAYYLGASASNLYAIYERLTTTADVSTDDNNERGLEEWENDSPQEVTLVDWSDFLNDRKYVHGYYDFFREQIQDRSMALEWKHSIKHFLVDSLSDDADREEEDEESVKNRNPNDPVYRLLDGVFSADGFGYGFTHLGFATETDNWELAAEALVLMASEYNNDQFGKLLSTYPLPPSHKTIFMSPIDILAAIRNDTKIPTVNLDFSNPDSFSNALSEFSKTHEKILEQYVSALDVSLKNVDDTLNDILTTLLILVSSTTGPFNPLFLNLLTCFQEVIEIILLASDHTPKSDPTKSIAPKNVIVPKEYIPLLLRNFWVLILMTYVSQSKPKLDTVQAIETSLSSSKSINFSNDNDYGNWNYVLETLFKPKTDNTAVDVVEYGPPVYSVVRTLLFASQYLTQNDNKQFGSGFFVKLAYKFVNSVN